MTQTERLAAFEAMLESVQEQSRQVEAQMRALKAQGRERSATYRQLMGNRLQLAQVLAMYKAYGLMEERDGLLFGADKSLKSEGIHRQVTLRSLTAFS